MNEVARGNALGNLCHCDCHIATHALDAANRLSALTDPFGNTYNYTYDLEGRRTRLDLPNGVAVDYTYDSLDRLTGITQRTSSTLLASYDYTLDPAGNRLGVTEADGSSIAWSYDDAYRLIGETRLDPGGATTSETTFAYDPVGNRLRMTVDGVTTNYAYNELDELLTAGANTYTYDARGNLTQVSSGDNVTTYSWDAVDRQRGITLPDGTALAYMYDADGRRVRKVVDGAETNHLWDEASIYGDVVLETDGSGTALAGYVLGGPELLSQTRSGLTSYYLADAQGSARALTNSAGGVTDTYDYTAFGELFASTATSANSYLYTGQQFDDLTGLYSLRARYYDPLSGRFLSRDPMEVEPYNPVEINRYVYVGNNPVNFVDPRGTWGVRDYAAIAVAALIAAPPLYQLSVALAAGFAVTAVTFILDPLRVLDGGPFGGIPDRVRDWIAEQQFAEAEARAFRQLLEQRQPKTTPEPISIDIYPPIDVPTPSADQSMAIFRAVDGRLIADGSYWRAPELRPPQFDPGTDLRGLSTFELQYLDIPESNLRHPYVFPFVVTLPGGNRLPLTSYPINVPGCTASYTPPPTGHWSVTCGGRAATRATLSTFARIPGNRGSAVINPYFTGTPKDRRFDWLSP